MEAQKVSFSVGKRPISWGRYLVLSWFCLTALFWSLSPGVTDGYSSSLRLLFWAIHVGLPLILLQCIQLVLSRIAAVRKQSALMQVLVGGIIGVIAFVPFALALDGGFPDSDPDLPLSLAAQAGSEFVSLVLPVSLAWLGLNAPRLLSVDARESFPPDAFDVSDPAEALWSKLPDQFGRDIVSLSAELHYLRVFSSNDEALVLFPFGVAVTLLRADVGLRIHRSHWVAIAHIDRIEKSGDRWTCLMRNGQEFPVSRRHRAELRERGISGA